MEVTNQSIQGFLKSIDASRLADILWIINAMEVITKRQPKLWGTIVGFGKLYYRYRTGHDGYMPILGFANRKLAITLYLSFDIQASPLLKQLGRYTAGKACLYIKRLSDINTDVLKQLIKLSYQESIGYDFVKVIE
ncbi:MAG: DUF1801 domain-containing protein [Bacilli bacterium]